jgi:UDP-N-acetylmuramate dehydrogenase
VPQRIAGYTTLRLGGDARRLVVAHDRDELVQAVREAGDPRLVLAGGSNVLVGDAGFDGTVILIRSSGVRIANDGEGVLVTVEAGHSWDDVVALAVAEGLADIEFLSGIPGSTGGTPIQNVGAYGREMAELLDSVTVLDTATDEVRPMTAQECRFGFRTSVFKRSSRYVVLDVTFQLRPGNLSRPIAYAELARTLGVEVGERAPLADVRDTVLALRARKGMVLDADDHDTWSVGSFFTNPVVPADRFDELQRRWDAPVPHYPADNGVKLAAGWLVENAGFGKGYPGSGDAPCRLSTKHALALTNRGNATTADVLALARTVRDGVRDAFGITLVPEPVLVGCSL